MENRIDSIKYPGRLKKKKLLEIINLLESKDPFSNTKILKFPERPK